MWTGSLRIGREAVVVNREGLNTTGRDDDRRVQRMTNLAQALMWVGMATGSGADLEEAIRLSREAVSALPATDERHWDHVTGLALVLANSYRQSLAWQDLVECIRSCRAVIAHDELASPRSRTARIVLSQALARARPGPELG